MEYYISQKTKKTSDGKIYGGFTEYQVWKRIEKFKLQLIYEHAQDYQGLARKPTKTFIDNLVESKISTAILYRDGPATDKHRLFYVPLRNGKMMDVYREGICKYLNIEI